MKKFVVGAVAAGLLALGAPTADAADSYRGGCAFRHTYVESHISQEDESVGVLYALVLATDDVAGTPLPIDGSCWIEVDGVPDDDLLEFSGIGVAADARDAAYLAVDDQTAQLCWDIDYGTSNDTGCTDPDFDGQLVTTINGYITTINEYLTTIYEPIWEATSIADPLLCPILAGLTPGVPGVVDIDPVGDVSIAGTLLWDCPPYGS